MYVQMQANRGNQARPDESPGAGLIQGGDMAVWTRKARNFIAVTIFISAAAGVIALVAGIIVHRFVPAESSIQKYREADVGKRSGRGNVRWGRPCTAEGEGAPACNHFHEAMFQYSAGSAVQRHWRSSAPHDAWAKTPSY